MKTKLQQQADAKQLAKQYINEFLQTIKEPFYSAKTMVGGTQYQTFLVNDKYIFKVGSTSKIKAEFVYNNYYVNDTFVQKLVFCDKNYRFIAYKCIEGSILPEYPNTKNVLKQVLKFINNYKPFHENGYGDVNKPSNSWEAFLTKLIADCKNDLKGVFHKEHFAVLENAVHTLSNYSFEKTLLHGDLRLENFIFEENVLRGIIDPYPMSGDALYDKLFFLYSSPEMANTVPLKKLHKKLKQPKDKVQAMLLIVLCVKLKRMVKYNNHQGLLAFYQDLFTQALEL